MQVGFQGTTRLEATQERVKEQVVSEDVEVAGAESSKNSSIERKSVDAQSVVEHSRARRQEEEAGPGDLLRVGFQARNVNYAPSFSALNSTLLIMRNPTFRVTSKFE